MTSNEGRRALLRNRIAAGQPVPFAIDFLEVASDQRHLLVTFFQNVPADGAGNPTNLALKNIEIVGGTRVTGIMATKLDAAGKVLTITVNQPGDFSIYTLRLVREPGSENPPDGFDPLLSQADFSFKIDCPTGFDCAEPPEEPDALPPSPPIDYLARDFNAFRRLMLDRMSALAPAQSERSPADATIALVELVAYAADQLSYYQDAVAAEAYLGTARRRTSLRRHARLLDYPMHDGCAARAWVALDVTSAADDQTLPGPTEDQPGALLLAGVADPSGVLAPTRLAAALNDGAQPYETLHDLMLYAAHNRMAFYTWGEDSAALPSGATRAWLKDDPANRLRLRTGDVLILQESLGPGSGLPADADPDHRVAVRLTAVNPEAALETGGGGQPIRTPAALRTDPLTGQAYVEIQWDAEDAPDFTLCLAAEIDGQPVTGMAHALGNVVLVEHGRTVPNPHLGETPEPLDRLDGRGRASLKQTPLTWQARVRTSASELLPFDPAAPASRAQQLVPGSAVPAVTLREGATRWKPERDLLATDRFSRAFAVEEEEDGLAFLRFGDGIFGRVPSDASALRAVYRVGSGLQGNVGRGAIRHILTNLPGIHTLDNPLPAMGGADPEAMEDVRQYAPQAFRRQERAVTAEDYAAAAARFPGVQRVQASMRWTGSWHTVFITVDRVGGLPVTPQFRSDLAAFLDPYRLAGYDLEVNAPLYVPLDITLSVCVRSGYFRADVERALLDTLSSRNLPGGKQGFFHPDLFSFGQPVHLSRLITAALAVDGVESVEATLFQRYGKSPNQELQNGIIPMGALEIARLDNDRNFPENGRLTLKMNGGL